MLNLPPSVAVFGPGLMGGSLLMALRQRSPQTQLGVWARRAEAVGEVRSRGLLDFGGTDAAEVAADCDLAVLCLPVERLAEVAAAIKDALPPRAVITDVGSVKKFVVEEMEKTFVRHGNFVGSHPMCGSEAAGLTAANADLYQGALCVLTPTPRSKPEALRSVAALWCSVGARILEMEPAEHDRAAAAVSHVPHLIAALLVELAARGNTEARQLCAGGFRDTTRIAAGSADLWTGILASNREEVIAALRTFAGSVEEVIAIMEKNDTASLQTLLVRAAANRAEMLSIP